MESSHALGEFTLRPAQSSDAPTIRRIINLVQINPTGLSWKRFILAVDGNGEVIGCGQVKPHKDGTFELASIAVLPEWRGRGVARGIIEQLLKEHPGRLYLFCRARMEPLYQKFGFQPILLDEMPPYYRNIMRMAAIYNHISHATDHLSVMRKN